MENIRLLSRFYLHQQFGGTKGEKKWSTFIHNGVMFPPLYEPHHIPIGLIPAHNKIKEQN